MLSVEGEAAKSQHGACPGTCSRPSWERRVYSAFARCATALDVGLRWCVHCANPVGLTAECQLKLALPARHTTGGERHGEQGSSFRPNHVLHTHGPRTHSRTTPRGSGISAPRTISCSPFRVVFWRCNTMRFPARRGIPVPHPPNTHLLSAVAPRVASVARVPVSGVGTRTSARGAGRTPRHRGARACDVVEPSVRAGTRIRSRQCRS